VLLLLSTSGRVFFWVCVLTLCSDWFGESVSLSDDLALVGALGKNISRGAAYLYSRDYPNASAWGQLKKLTASDAATEYVWSVGGFGCVF